jgi:hypothetical protein
MHQGTSTRNALCGRFHEVQLFVADNGTLMASLHVMADFGRSRLAATSTWLTPPECPNQGSISGTNGIRRIPTGTDGYTPYVVDQNLPGMGLVLNAQFLTTDGRTTCPNATCATLGVNADKTGSRRRFQVLDDGVSISAGTGHSGTFYTDQYGAIVSAGTPGAIAQYIAPGFSTSMEEPKASQDTTGAKRNGMWHFAGESGGMNSAWQQNNYNGAPPLLPLSLLDGDN